MEPGDEAAFSMTLIWLLEPRHGLSPTAKRASKVLGQAGGLLSELSEGQKPRRQHFTKGLTGDHESTVRSITALSGGGEINEEAFFTFMTVNI